MSPRTGNQEPWQSRKKGQKGPPQSQETNRETLKPRPWINAEREPRDKGHRQPKDTGPLRAGGAPECLRDCPPIIHHTTRHSGAYMSPQAHKDTHMFSFTHIHTYSWAWTSDNDSGTQIPSRIIFRNILACTSTHIQTYTLKTVYIPGFYLCPHRCLPDPQVYLE